MIQEFIMAFLPELVLLAGVLAVFVVTLDNDRVARARAVSLATAAALVVSCLITLRSEATLFDGAYRVDLFSQWLKLAFGVGYLAVILLGRRVDDIRPDIRPEFFLFLGISMTGFVFLASSIDAITLVVSLELSSFPLFLLVAMRRERKGQRMQMESAIKFMMFGVAANGVMLFGLSYLYGLTSTTSIPLMVQRLQPVIDGPLALAGLGLTFAGLYYKLAVFPFHFWTPDVYQGASNETAGIIASMPKLGAVVILVRFAAAATPDNQLITEILTVLAVASMFYGNLVALVQRDLKRLLGFSTIAHAGYTLLGFVALDEAGFSASLYYMTGYLFMVLACFVVISRVSRDGENVAIEDLHGLHRRSPLLALTMVIGIFALAGIPPFVGFMGKFALLNAAFARGHTVLVILAVINTAIAAYYYLRVVHASFFGDRDATDQMPIALDGSTRALCIGLIAIVILLGVTPAPVIDAITTSLASVVAVP